MPYTKHRIKEDGLSIEMDGLLQDNYPIAKESMHEYSIKNFAYRFYKQCRGHEYITVSMLNSAKRSIVNSDENMVVILADGLTWKKSHIREYFDKARQCCETMDDYFDLISVTAMSVYLNSSPETQLDTKFLEEAIGEFVTKYSQRFMIEIKRFILRCLSEIELNNYRHRQAEIKRELYWIEHFHEFEAMRRAEINKKHYEEQRKRNEELLREEIRLENIRKREQAQRNKQQENNERRARFLDSFAKLSLEDRLFTIALDKRRNPKYYALQYDQISDEELRSVNKAVLVAAYDAFPHMRDKNWQALRKRIAVLI